MQTKPALAGFFYPNARKTSSFMYAVTAIRQLASLRFGLPFSMQHLAIALLKFKDKSILTIGSIAVGVRVIVLVAAGYVFRSKIHGKEH